MILWAVLGGFVLDALFGDPAWLPHPVVLVGKCISRLEKFLRARLPKTPQGEVLGGGIVAFCLPVGTFLVTSFVCLAAVKLSPCKSSSFICPPLRFTAILLYSSGKGNSNIADVTKG